MYKLVIAILLITSISCSPAQERAIYMFSYFMGNGADGLHLAYSEDGYKWEAINNNESVLTPTAGEDKLMRDPCIIRGPKGKFHMVWTVSWHEQGIGYAWSEDLINWSEQQYLPVMEHEPTAQNCWAPELFYDEKNQEFMIYWSTTIPGRFPETANKAEEDWNHRVYYATTKDFKTLSDTKLLLDPGFNVIDAVITRHKDQYVMVVKDETKFPVAQKDLHITFSENLTSGYGPVSPAITNHWVEGPTITRVADQWVIYFDRYREHEMGAVASKDLENWTDISDKISFPDGTRHGTVFKVTRDELEKLQ